ESIGDRRAVRAEAVRRDLERSGCRRVPQAFDEDFSGGLIALAHGDIQNQFAVALDCNERVGVTEVLIVLRPHALLLLADEAPQLVTFDIAHLDVADLRRHDPLTLFTSEYQEFQ